MSVKPSIAQFSDICVKLLDIPGLLPEFAYRIGKLMDNMAALDDKVYLKTLRGKEILSQCIEKAVSLEKHLTGPGDFPYLLVTDLEMDCEELLVLTYQFRIKAG